MTPRCRHDLAVRLATELFTNGQGERAQRLVLTIDKPTSVNLGGWNYNAAVDLIERLLASAQA